MGMKKKILLGLMLLLPLSLSSCVTVGIEKPQYSVLEKQGKFEIRQYEPQIVAETVVDSTKNGVGRRMKNGVRP